MNPIFDYHALAPELVLSATIVVVLVADFFFPDREGWQTSRLASLGVLLALVPVADAGGRRLRPLAVRRRVRRRRLRPRAQGLLPPRRVPHAAGLGRLHRRGRLLPGRVLLPAAVVGARHGRDGIGARPDLDLRGARADLDPDVRAGRLAQARHEVERGRDQVLPDRRAVVGGDALRHVADLRPVRRQRCSPTSASSPPRANAPPLFAVAIFLTLVGFAFKVSAVPFHFWAPDTYEGSPTPGHRVPVGGVEGGRLRRDPEPRLLRVLPGRGLVAARAVGAGGASMTLGNLTALRQTNIVRMLAYSSIAQGGFILVPLAVAQDGARGVVRGRRHLPAHLRRDEPGRVRGRDRGRPAHPFGRDLVVRRSGPDRAGGSAMLMSVFLFSLAGIPPLAGWFAKFVMFRAVFEAGDPGGGGARRDRRGELGDRVLLLRRGGAADVVRGPADRIETGRRVHAARAHGGARPCRPRSSS